jgi:hypothetical protein
VRWPKSNVEVRLVLDGASYDDWLPAAGDHVDRGHGSFVRLDAREEKQNNFVGKVPW